jgi:hypothetical protein
MSESVEKLLSETQRLVAALSDAAGAGSTAQELGRLERKLLEVLLRAERWTDVAGIARTLLIPVTELERTLPGLERGGWIARRREAHAPQVMLTAAGRARWQDACDNEQALYDQLGNTLDDDSIRSALVTLRALRRKLERCGYAQMPTIMHDSATIASHGLHRALCA